MDKKERAWIILLLMAISLAALIIGLVAGFTSGNYLLGIGCLAALVAIIGVGFYLLLHRERK